MLRKHYVANVIEIKEEKSFVVGTVINSVFFFRSARFAYERINCDINNISDRNLKVRDFRRVK